MYIDGGKLTNSKNQMSGSMKDSMHNHSLYFVQNIIEQKNVLVESVTLTFDLSTPKLYRL